MSCFAIGRTTSSSRMSSMGKNRSWRWWRKCAGLAAAAHSRLRRSVLRVRWSAAPGDLGGGRRGRRAPPMPSVQRGHHHRSFAPVYVDELYSQQPKGLISVVHEEEPSTSASKVARVTAATAGNTTTTTRAGGNEARVAAAAGGNKARAAAAAARSLLLSPMRGGGVVGMGEVDMRAELFIRKFREEMRLQSQKSAEELQAMLARGL